MNNETMIKNEYQRWYDNATADLEVKQELIQIEGDWDKIEDAFYRDLEFGTGGLRGLIGAGTNRMNIYTVARVSQGVASYVVKNFEPGTRKIAVSFDSRIKSDVFARVAAGVFAANGIHAYIYKQLMPTPCLSYAVRELKCAAGIMVTASHNPADYNGYKVYGSDGCQITTKVANLMLEEIQSLDIFSQILQMDFDEGLERGIISWIDESVYTSFINEIKKQSLLAESDDIDKNISIVYTPLNGTGLEPVTRVLRESGYTNITLVEEQKSPNGHFSTCPYPNPEIKEALSLGIEYAKKNNEDLLIATDPDCDRVGIAVRCSDGDYNVLSGNEIGILLLDYICARRIESGNMPDNAVFIKTIVTTDMAERIAASYGLTTINVLTGFKFIGEQIGLLEKSGKEHSYIFGFEESHGYLSGSYVRDKDGVEATFLICEMFSFYKNRGISLLEKLHELYDKHGFYIDSLYSFEFEGHAGFNKMSAIMEALRQYDAAVGTFEIIKVIDYMEEQCGLSKSDVLKFIFKDNCSAVVRPSGTEPKLKVYISVMANTMEAAANIETQISEEFESIIKK